MITASSNADGKFALKIGKRTSAALDSVVADYLLIATGSSKEVV